MPSPAPIALVPALAASVPAERREAVERAAFQFALALALFRANPGAK